MKHLPKISILLFICYILIVISERFLWFELPIIIGGGLSAVFFLHSFKIRKERNWFKEENQYFIDAFQNLRQSVSLLQAPLENVYTICTTENVRDELLLTIDSLKCLDGHLTRLMGLKQLHVCPDLIYVGEYELGSFLKERLYPLQQYAGDLGISLKYKMDFEYLSVWLDPSKISPVIEKFIIYILHYHTKSDSDLILFISSDGKYWSIKIRNILNTALFKRTLRFFWEMYAMPYLGKDILIRKLLKQCKGWINMDGPDLELKFPVSYSDKINTKLSVSMPEKVAPMSWGLFFMEPSKRISGKYSIVIADKDEHFGEYLKRFLSGIYNVRLFRNGLEAYESIREEYPDLVLCDVYLPGMNGDELSSKLKTSINTSFIPVVLLGSSLDTDERNMRKRSLADLYLHKSIHPEDLKMEISVLISNSYNLRRSFVGKVFGEQFLEKRVLPMEKDSNIEFIRKAKEYILANLENEKLTIDDVASQMCMSRTSFFNKWKSLIGEAPKYIIYRLRMEKARELLESGNYSVSMVPEKVGLKNIKNFRGQYKEYFGKSPKESLKKGLNS